MRRTFVSSVEPIPDRAGIRATWWFAVRAGELLILEDTESGIPYGPDLSRWSITPLRSHYLGVLLDAHCIAVELPDDTDLPRGLSLQGLRALYGRLPEDLYALAGRAAQIVEWDRTHRYCGRCGAPTVDAPGERAKRCPECGLLNYPRLSPAVITRVERDGEILLARGRQFLNGMYSVLAGFVEPGESLEEAVQREIMEEVGIEVRDVRYFGSQPWPFPNSLMIGFTARHSAGEIQIDEREIADARWFRPDALPRIPQKLSIARQLIDDYLAKRGLTYHDS
jgi:NAD+ diphosphatase